MAIKSFGKSDKRIGPTDETPERFSEQKKALERLPPWLAQELFPLLDPEATEKPTIEIQAEGKEVLLIPIIVEEIVGRGDFSVVLKGFDKDRKQQPLAIKIFAPPPQDNKEVGEQSNKEEEHRIAFVREAELYQMLGDVNNIARLVAFGLIKGGSESGSEPENPEWPVIVREWIPNLLARHVGPPYKPIEDEKRLSPRQIIELLRHISEALKSAGQKGIIICDLSIHNIGKREDGTWVILDIGLSAQKGTDYPVAYDELFTAPELGLGKTNLELNNDASQRTQGFSLARIAASLLAGEMPERVLTKITGSAVDALDGRPAFKSLPPAVREVLRRAESQEPLNRYETLDDFVSALEKAMKESGMLD